MSEAEKNEAEGVEENVAEAEADAAEEVTPVSDGPVLPRVWPAAALLVLYWATVVLVTHFGATTLGDFYPNILAPLLFTVLLGVWWIAASRVPARDRLVGSVVFSGAVACVLLSQLSMPIIILSALPVMTTVAVLTLLVTSALPWSLRRVLGFLSIVLVALTFMAMRVESFSGSLTPVLSWRWETTGETLLAETAAERTNRVATLPAELGPADWPGFRGARRNGRQVQATFDTDWSTLPKEVWRRPVGRGLSSFTVIGDYLFTQEQRGAEETVVCYEAATGEEVWVNRATALFEEMMGGGPRATPTYHAGHLYTVGATGIVQRIDASTGATVWQHDMMAELGKANHQWGFASSPLITNGLAVVFAGGAEGEAVVAYKIDGGELAWQSGKGESGYSSGQLANIGEVPQILMNSNFGIQALAPETGAVLWEHAWATNSNPRVVQPLVHDSRSILIGTAGGQGTRLLHVQKGLESWTVNERWTEKSIRPYFNDFVFHEGFCYGFDGNRLVCYDPLTGNLRWKGPRVGGQILAVSEIDMLIVLTEKGEVLLVEALTDRYTERARFQALEGKTWNHPVVAGDKLYVRNNDEAVCYALPPVPVVVEETTEESGAHG